MLLSSSNGKHDGSAVVKAVISLGSNIGERERHIMAAAARIASSAGIASARLSPLYETSPMGEGYSRPFVNAVMVIETTLPPRALLGLGQGLERETGRAGGKGDRTLDIDIILHGENTVDDADLKIPHPRFMERLFVLVPLADLDPDLPLPGGATASKAAKADEAGGRVQRISFRSRISRKSL